MNVCFLKKFIDFFRDREKGGWEWGGISLLFHWFMHLLVDSCLCPDQRWSPQSLCIRTMLQPLELPRPGPICAFDIREKRNVLRVYIILPK